MYNKEDYDEYLNALKLLDQKPNNFRLPYVHVP